MIEYQGRLCYIKPQMNADFIEWAQPVARENSFTSFSYRCCVAPCSGIIPECALKRNQNQNGLHHGST